MLKLGRVTKVKVLFLVLVYVFNFDLFEFSAAILEKSPSVSLHACHITGTFYFISHYVRNLPIFYKSNLRMSIGYLQPLVYLQRECEK